MSAGGIAPILAVTAARRRRQQEEEEEKMSTYNSQELDGWEFKIVRSTFGRFSNYEAVQKVCHEEAETGWELVEKFDSCRLRFKRRVERRAGDHQARLDPYRTSPSLNSNGKLVALVLGIVLLLGGIMALLLLNRTSGDPSVPNVFLIVAAIAVLLIVMVLFRRRR